MRCMHALITIALLAGCARTEAPPDGGDGAKALAAPVTPPPEVRRTACPEGTSLQGAAPPQGIEERCERPGGVREGRTTQWHTSGAVAAEGAYRDSRKDGPWTFWHPNGKKASEGTYQQGQRNGRWTFWHENGQMAEEGEYRGGQEDGTWARWDEQGNPLGETRYENGWQRPR